MGTPSIRLLCVDDNELVCDALARKFAGLAGFEWCGALPDASGLIERALACRPHVVLLDLEMPGPNAIEEARKLTEALPECRVIVLSGTFSELQVDKAMAAGATGFLSKAEASAEIINAVERAAAGEVVLGTEIRIAVGLRPAVR